MDESEKRSSSCEYIGEQGEIYWFPSVEKAQEFKNKTNIKINPVLSSFSNYEDISVAEDNLTEIKNDNNYKIIPLFAITYLSSLFIILPRVGLDLYFFSSFNSFR